MRRRAVTLGAVVVFAMGLLGLVALDRPSGRGAGPGLVPLPALTGARSMAAASGAQPAPAGRQVVVEGALPKLPKTAEAWQLADHVDEARVAQLAKAFGLSGVPAATTGGGSGWSVSDGNRILQVLSEQGAPWMLGPVSSATACEPPAPPPPPCAADGACPTTTMCRVVGTNPSASASTGNSTASIPGAASTSSSIASTATTTVGPRPPSPPAAPATAPDGPPATPTLCRLPQPQPPCPADLRCQVTCAPVGPPPTTAPVDEHLRAGAVGAAVSLVRSLGFEADASHAVAFPTFGGWAVTVQPVVGGAGTQGWSQEMVIDAEGAAVSGFGSLALPTKAGAYPLVGLQAGLDRLGRGEIAWTGGSESLMSGAVAVSRPPVTNVAGPATTILTPGSNVGTAAPSPGSAPAAPAFCVATTSQPTVPTVPCPSPVPPPSSPPCVAAGAPTTAAGCAAPRPAPPPCGSSRPPMTPPCAQAPPMTACSASGAPTTTACVVPATIPATAPPLVVTGARLGLDFSRSSGSAAWLEPVYVFTTREGDISVPAVVDGLMAAPGAGAEPPAPYPMPAMPGGPAPAGPLLPTPSTTRPTTRPTTSPPPPTTVPPATVTIGSPPTR